MVELLKWTFAGLLTAWLTAVVGLVVLMALARVHERNLRRQWLQDAEDDSPRVRKRLDEEIGVTSKKPMWRDMANPSDN